MEGVTCIECGENYDSSTQTFCPRCGNTSTRKGMDPTALRPAAFDPRRKRVQVGGIILLTIASVTMLSYGVALVEAPNFLQDLPGDLFEAQAGGDVLVHFGNGTAIEGAVVNVTWTGGSVNGTTDANGTFAYTSASAMSVANITWNGQTWSREIMSLSGFNHEFSLSTEDSLTGPREGVEVLVNPIRGLLGFFMAMNLFVVAAGVAAVRLRAKNLAIGGAVAGLLPVFILATAVPNILSLALVVVMSAALAFIIQGRRAFR